MGKISSGFIRALQEEQERGVGIYAGANRIVRQQEFSKLGVEPGGLGFNLGEVESIRRGISVTVKGGTIDARPKACA